MSRRATLGVLGTISVCLNTPVAAGAGAPSAPQRPAVVVIGPVHIRAYELSIDVYTPQPASAGERASPPTLIVDLTRTAGRSVGRLPITAFVQSHTIFMQSGVHIAVARSLGSADVRASLRRFGTIDLHLTAPRVRRTNNCPLIAHEGTARGTVRLALGGGYFGVISLQRLPGLVGLVSGCQTAVDAAPDAASLSLLAGDPRRLGRQIQLDTGNAWMFAFVRRDRNVELSDSITANAPPRSALTGNHDLSRAKLRAFGPFLTGSATYTASRTVSDEVTKGTLSGDLTAKLDAPGPVRLVEPPLPATLLR